MSDLNPKPAATASTTASTTAAPVKKRPVPKSARRRSREIELYFGIFCEV